LSRNEKRVTRGFRRWNTIQKRLTLASPIAEVVRACSEGLKRWTIEVFDVSTGDTDLRFGAREAIVLATVVENARKCFGCHGVGPGRGFRNRRRPMNPEHAG
jgi:hypothetical protein